MHTNGFKAFIGAAKMAKGKKTVHSSNKKPEDSAEQKVSSQNDSKENKPVRAYLRFPWHEADENPCLPLDGTPVHRRCNNKRKKQPHHCIQKCTPGSSCKTPSLFHSQRPRKSRSPLSDSSSTLIQKGNESDTTNPDSSELKKDKSSEMIGDSCESKDDQKPEMPCQSHRTRDQTTDTCEEKDTASTAENKPSATKTRRATGRKHRVKRTVNKASQNRKVTDYYPIRRSNRKTKAELKDEEHKHIDDLIKNGVEEGMQVKRIEGKGRGVFALRAFKKGAFVVEYHGDLLERAEAKIREALYAQDPQTGCYMYYFQYRLKNYCVDATKETDRLGRLINHSKNGNCQTKLHAINGTPHLIFVASRDIEENEELLYDYGDRSKDAILAHPWLKY